MEKWLYALCDKEYNNRIYGVFTSTKKLIEARIELTEIFVEECLAQPTEESGLTETDRALVFANIYQNFTVQILYEGIDKLHYKKN